MLKIHHHQLILCKKPTSSPKSKLFLKLNASSLIIGLYFSKDCQLQFLAACLCLTYPVPIKPQKVPYSPFVEVQEAIWFPTARFFGLVMMMTVCSNEYLFFVCTSIFALAHYGISLKYLHLPLTLLFCNCMLREFLTKSKLRDQNNKQELNMTTKTSYNLHWLPSWT